MTDTRSAVPSFTINNVTFTCWITDKGQVYEWPDETGRAKLRRNIGSSRCSAMVDGKIISKDLASGRDAMSAAAEALRVKASETAKG